MANEEKNITDTIGNINTAIDGALVGNKTINP